MIPTTPKVIEKTRFLNAVKEMILTEYHLTRCQFSNYSQELIDIVKDRLVFPYGFSFVTPIYSEYLENGLWIRRFIPEMVSNIYRASFIWDRQRNRLLFLTKMI